QPRLLHNGAAVLDDLDLAPRLVLDSLPDEADRIDVLDLATGVERLTRLAHRDIDVGAQAAFLHVAVASAEVPQYGAQLRDISLRLVGGAQIRLRHDLHQRHAGAVEIDQRHRRVLIVDRFAGVLFEMQPLDADTDGFTVRHIDDDFALAHDRRLVLADLVAGR